MMKSIVLGRFLEGWRINSIPRDLLESIAKIRNLRNEMLKSSP